jgi:hypothetical protein
MSPLDRLATFVRVVRLAGIGLVLVVAVSSSWVLKHPVEVRHVPPAIRAAPLTLGNAAQASSTGPRFDLIVVSGTTGMSWNTSCEALTNPALLLGGPTKTFIVRGVCPAQEALTRPSHRAPTIPS